MKERFLPIVLALASLTGGASAQVNAVSNSPIQSSQTRQARRKAQAIPVSDTQLLQITAIMTGNELAADKESGNDSAYHIVSLNSQRPADVMDAYFYDMGKSLNGRMKSSVTDMVLSSEPFNNAMSFEVGNRKVVFLSSAEFRERPAALRGRLLRALDAHETGHIARHHGANILSAPEDNYLRLAETQQMLNWLDRALGSDDKKEIEMLDSLSRAVNKSAFAAAEIMLIFSPNADNVDKEEQDIRLRYMALPAPTHAQAKRVLEHYYKRAAKDMAQSRRQEFEADAAGAKATCDPEALRIALNLTLAESRRGQSSATGEQTQDALSFDHPYVATRDAHLSWMEKHPPAGCPASGTGKTR